MEIWCLAVLYFGLLLLQQTENFHNSRNDLWSLESRILVRFNWRWILTTVNVRGFIMLDYLPFWKLILNSLGCLLLKRPGSIRVLGNLLSNFDSILGTLMHQCHVRTGMYPASVTDRTLGLSQQCSFLPRKGERWQDFSVLSEVRALSLTNQIEGLTLHVHYPVRVPASEVK